MKKILLISLLVLFGCSKESMETDSSGNQIIGNYQLILQTSADQQEFSYWDIRKESPNTGFAVGATASFLTTNLTGKVNFSSDFKGYYDIIVEDENIKVNFDWSFEGGKWYLTDSNSNVWRITNSDRCVSYTIYCSKGQANSDGVYIMMRLGGYGTGDWRSYKLVF
jgi:hypothetical protein